MSPPGCGGTLPLETVGIAEEEAEGDTEVGHESVGGPAFEETGTYGVERRWRRRLKADVVEAPPAEHWRLSVGLGVADDLEDIEHGGRTNFNEGEPHASSTVSWNTGASNTSR